MLRLLKWYFISVGFISTAAVVFGGVWFMSLPSQVRGMAWSFVFPPSVDLSVSRVTSSTTAATPIAEIKEAVASTAKAVSPAVTDAQAKALQSVGVDPASVPASFTPEQIACFESVLGIERVAQIKGGAVPTFAEFTKSSACF